MTDMIVRRATPKDTDRINDLLFQVAGVHSDGRPDIFKSGSKKYTDEELLAIISDDSTPIFVAEDENGYVCGYAFCIYEITEGSNLLCDMKTLYIDDLCVDEKCRGGGVGRALYEYALEYAKKIGCYNLTLNVWECNPTAKRFYEKMGLLPQKTVMETRL